MVVHGQKYPKHELSAKGSVFGGECNRTACRAPDATHFNLWTFGYYCAPCARAINGGELLCVEVDHDMTIEQMDALHREKAYYA